MGTSSRGIHCVFSAPILCWAALCAQGTGLEFSTPTPLNPDADTLEESSTAIKTDGKGHWVAAWTSGPGPNEESDILVSRSSNNGETWTNPIPLNNNAAIDSAHDGWVNLATDCAGNWLAVWTSQAEGEDFDLLSARSINNGATWTDPVPVTQNTGDELIHSLATDKNGVWMVVSETTDTVGDEIGPDQELIVMRSTDNGATWSPPRWLNTNAPTDSRNDYEPSIAVDVRGLWVVSWFADQDDDYRIYIARSSNAGVTWSNPAALNSSPVDYSDGASLLIATDSKGHWVAAWNAVNVAGNEVRILASRSTDGAQSWSAAKPINPDSANDSNFDYLMSLATDEHGNWVAAWLSEDQLDEALESDIEAAFSTDNGEMWSEPVPIDTSDDSSNENDYFPRLASDGSGNWVCTWDSFRWQGGPFGSVYVARAFLPISTAGLKVLVPNGGEKWKQGSKHALTWEPAGKAAYVRIELVRNGGKPVTIQQATPDDGSYAWKIPKDLKQGRGWKISITSVGNPELKDQSDSDFRIKRKE